MLGSSRAVRPPSGMHTVFIGMVGSVVLTVLLAWRFGATWKEILHGAASTWHVLLFLLGSWLLYQDVGGSGTAKKVMNGLALVFTIFRTISYTRLSIMNDIPQKIAPLFDSSSTGYLGFGLYSAASLFMLVLLHRVLPSWMCTSIGLLHGGMFSWIGYRLVGKEQPTMLQVLHMIAMGQVGMFAPYFVLTHPYIQRAVARASRRRTAASSACTEAAGNLAKDSCCKQVGDYKKLSKAKEIEPLYGSEELEEAALGAQPAAATVILEGGPPSSCAKVGMPSSTTQQMEVLKSRSSRTIGSSPSELMCKDLSGSTVSPGVKPRRTAVQHMSQAPYKSKIRATHTVCVKLDTNLSCSSLPEDMAQQLQSALRASLGSSLSLGISDLAVRPGCICITMKIEKQMTDGDTQLEASTHSQLHLDELAQVLLPQLQGMLSQGQVAAAVQRSTVQLDDGFVACTWQQDRQAWDVHVKPAHVAENTDSRPWLGVATGTRLQAAAAHANGSGLSQSPELLPPGLFSMVAEVQLWNSSKSTKLHGWTPPEQHSGGVSGDVMWPEDRQLSRSPLQLLARAAGGYLPTKVLAVQQDHAHGGMSVQVLVQLHEHQLVRHHEGGSPSTLLLMDLELWQNEVLLSSSPLLSVPAVAETSRNPLATQAWWWGAADSTVAAAVAEIQSCAEECAQLSADADTHHAIHTFVQFLQDLAIWLAQVQRIAHASQLCQYGEAASGKLQGAGMLQAPTLDPSACKQLGEELISYAEHVGWTNVRQMLVQQMRKVVTPAACSTVPSGTHHWVSCSMRTAKAVVLGYPCHHDEQLYKQQLAVHMAAVLPLSTTALTVIGGVMLLRAFPSQDAFIILLTLAWVLIHAAAMVAMLCAGFTQQPGAHSKYIGLALRITTAGYVWKAVGHLPVVLLTSQPAGKEVYTHVFQRQHLWGAMKLVTLLCSQVPASVLLPAPLVTFMALLLEFPALLLDVMRSSSWHPVTCVITTFLLAVGARFVLDAQLRMQLTRPNRAHGAHQSSGRHVKAE